MITYEDIKKVSDAVATTNIKGKDYPMVNGRIDAFRKLYPEGFITSEIISMEGGMFVMKATCGYYDDNGQPVILGTGHAYEKEGSSQINRTSALENCETSCWGRALSACGICVGSSVASSEEMQNAIQQQEATQADTDPQRRTALIDEINDLMKTFSADEKRTIFSLARTEAGIEPKKDGTPKTSGIMKVSELEKVRACVVDVIGRMK